MSRHGSLQVRQLNHPALAELTALRTPPFYGRAAFSLGKAGTRDCWDIYTVKPHNNTVKRKSYAVSSLWLRSNARADRAVLATARDVSGRHFRAGGGDVSVGAGGVCGVDSADEDRPSC